MNVLFVYSTDDVRSPDAPFQSWTAMQFGISYVSSMLLSRGHRTSLLVLGSNSGRRQNERLIAGALRDFRPEVACYTAVASQYRFISGTARRIRERQPGIFSVIGGVHTTLKPGEILSEESPYDALCVGEGEHPAAELCGQLAQGRTPGGIPNLWIRRSGGDSEKNPPRPFLQDLDSLPFPDRAMWKPWIHDSPGAEVAVLLGRGCPFDCSYCCNHAIRKTAPGKYVRTRSAANVVAELELIRDTFPGRRRIYFEVESVALDKTWLFGFCEALAAFNSRSGCRFAYRSNFRVSRESADEKVFAALKSAAFDKLNIGLESGSERVRREILRRNYTNREFLDTVAAARKHGLQISLFNMIGLPGETFEDHLETVKMNRECQPEEHSTSIFFPYPGTDLYDECLRRGFIHGDIDCPMERRRAAADLPGMGRAAVQSAYTWFNYRVYCGHRPLWWVLTKTFLIRLHSIRWADALFRAVSRWPVLGSAREFFARRLRARECGAPGGVVAGG